MRLSKLALVLSLSILNVCSYAFATETTNDDQWDGKQYLNNSELQYQWATSYVKKMKLIGTEKILDIGCGDGRVTAVIARALPEGSILGIDTSDSMLEAAKNLKNKINFCNLDFIKRDATHMKFEKEFDFVVSFSCLHWIFDHYAVIQEIEKALKPGGKVFLYFVPDHGRNRIDHAINSVVSSSTWAQYFANFSTPYFFITPSKFLFN